MRAAIAAIVLVATGAGATANECRFGTNRPAIDTMERHVTPGTRQITCTQQTITLQTPSGGQREVRTWTFSSSQKDKK